MRISVEEYKKMLKKPHKYNAKATIVDGIRFDSKAEAKRYRELKLLKQAGDIKDFILQPKFVLIPAEKGPDGKTRRAVHYVADFLVTYPDGKREVEDVKGMITPVYRLKKRLFEHKFGMTIKEIRK